MPASLSGPQQALVARPPGGLIFLEGPAGAGKTTAAVARLLRLLAGGVPATAILVLLPQRTLAAPYEEALAGPDVPAGGQVTLLTLGGLAQRMVDLFWPLAAGPAGFGVPAEPPVFLTLETAQYYMAQIVQPLLARGYFDSLSIDRNRLYSQILDNLNKAAVVGFPHTEIASRLKMAWLGDKTQLRIYDEAQECAVRFREFCLAHNLLDFSLQYEVFVRHLWTRPECRDYLAARYTHLFVDNLEEDTAVAHDLLREWLPVCKSALLVYDWDAGYRRFLGADPGGAHTLADLCPIKVVFDASFVTTPALRALSRSLGRSLGQPAPKRDGAASPAAPSVAETAEPDVTAGLRFEYHRYYPEMIDWVGAEAERLIVNEGVQPGQIAVLAPFLSDALRFLLAHALAERGVPVRSHRPSRALCDEPAAQCLLVLAALAHPAWGYRPPPADVTHALGFAITGLDRVRARLLVDRLYRVRAGVPVLAPFDELNGAVQERVTYVLGRRYERLRRWLAAYGAGAPAELDHFLTRLFGEVLSQPGFAFHSSFDAGEVAANLIESVRKFRHVMGERRPPAAAGLSPALELGRQYTEMARQGVVAAQYVRSWRRQPDNAVLLAPAYTFLMSNQPVDYQFWLDVGSPGWWQRLSQPLTHPYVLSRSWPPGALWTDRHEFEARGEALYALVTGLIRRCRRTVYLGLSELGQEGRAQQGPLLRALQGVLRRSGE